MSKNQTSISTAGMLRMRLQVLSLLLLAGCEGVQSTLAPQGPHAAVIANISWIMFAGAAAILLLVMGLAFYAIYRQQEKRPSPSANTLIIAGGVALPVLTLTALLVYTVYAMAELRSQSSSSGPSIEVVGNRWWWDVHYRTSDGAKISSANEIRIPVGRPVEIALRTNDVIHSFWVPNLAGKMDLVPGRVNRIVLQADAPGVYRGQCAEYCGAQHAHMAFYVIAESPADHAAWLARQEAPARVPIDNTQVRGRDLFISSECVRCHTVRGVATATEPGPDLTHVGSREFIAAGMLPNNAENLASFIAHSQKIKPRSGMPSYEQLPPEDLHAIATYLGSLK